MTHEHIHSPMTGQHELDGPEHAGHLPDATSIPEYPADSVHESLAPPLIDVSPLDQPIGSQYVGASPRWWVSD